MAPRIMKLWSRNRTETSSNRRRRHSLAFDGLDERVMLSTTTLGNMAGAAFSVVTQGS
jgi:hypothetical protein